MNKSIFTLMTAALLMTGSVFSNAYAAVGEKVAIAATKASPLEGSKFYIGDNANGQGLFKTKVEKVDYATYDGKDDVESASNVVTTAAVFEARNIQASGSKAVTFELWVNGKQFVTKADGAAAETTDKLENLATRFLATYNDAKEASTLAFTKFYTNVAPNQEITNATAYLATAEQDADFLQEYNSKGITLSFTGKNIIGNAFSEALQVVKVVANAIDNSANPASGGFVLVKGTADDVKAFVTAAGKTDGSIVTAAEKVSFLSLTNETYPIDGKVSTEGVKIKVLEKGTYVPATAMSAVLFTKVEQIDVLNDPEALKFTMGDVMISGVQPDGQGDNVYVTTMLANGTSKLTFNPATLGANSYLDASILLKENAKNTVNIYFTSGKQSIDGDAAQQYEYHKYLVAGVGSAFQLEARAKSEIDLASPMTQWVVSGFDGKATFTLTNREASAVVNTLNLKLKATDNAGEYEIETSNINLISAGVTPNATIAGNDVLAGKVVRFNTVATTKTDGFLNMTKEEREGGFHLMFTGGVPGGVATFYGNLANNTTAGAFTPAAGPGSFPFTAELAKSTTGGKTNYVINEVNAAYLDKDGNLVTIKDTLIVPTYKLVAGKTSTPETLYLKDDATATVTTSNIGEFFFRKNMDGTYAMGKVATTGAGVFATDFAYNAAAVEVASAGNAFAMTTATIYAPVAVSNVTLAWVENTDVTSLPAGPRHASFDNVLGSVAMQMNKNGFEEGILSKEGLTFWLDTVGKATVPYFYISRGVEGQTERLFMFNSKDSLGLFSEDDAQLSANKNYLLEGTASDSKAIFRSATLIAKDTLATTIDGEATKLVKDDLKAYQFSIYLADDAVEDEYIVKSAKGGYLYALNGKLGFTTDPKTAMVFTLGDDVPTANEGVEVSTISVIAKNGAIQIAGAAGKKVVISNILGQVVANTVITSNDATIAAPAGIVVVAVEGEAAVKAIVK